MPDRRPEASEYPPRYGRYLDLVPETNLPTALLGQLADSTALFNVIPDQLHSHRYEEGKWTIVEVLGHILDTERILGYRLLTCARGGEARFTRADENAYVRNAEFANRPLRNLLEEFANLRRSHVLMLGGLPPAAWNRTGMMADSEVSVRAMAYLMLGHERHHLEIIRTRYLKSA
jgi:hypothetical protein